MSNTNTLKEKYSEWKKDSLYSFAKELGLKKLSSLNKPELIDRICEELEKPETMFYRLSILDDREHKIFESAVNSPVHVNDDNFMEAFMVADTQYADVDPSENLNVLEDAIPIWNNIKGSDFDSYRKKASWVWRCLNWCEEMYGYFPVETFLDVVNIRKGMRMNKEELMEIYNHFPLDQMFTIKLDDKFISYKYAIDMDELDHLISSQADKTFYIPKTYEIDELYSDCALTSDTEYQNMRRFLKSAIGMDENEAKEILSSLFTDISTENDPLSTLQWFLEKIPFDNEDQAKTAVDLFMKLSNDTRMISNRGHKPTEVMRMHPFNPGVKPTIVAGSSNAANMLSQIAPEIRNMGFSLDLESNAATVPVMGFPNGINGEMKVGEKKIYPNDPCPCGSGKKYKKCCGRNR